MTVARRLFLVAVVLFCSGFVTSGKIEVSGKMTNGTVAGTGTMIWNTNNWNEADWG